MHREWGRIAWLYALGVLAAAQLGKMSALVPLISIELAMGLTVAGVLISLLEIGGATLGFAAGLFVDRIGVRRVLLTGIGFFALAGLGESLAPSVAALVGLRLLEGAAYLCVVVAAPLLIFRTAPHRPSAKVSRWRCGAVSCRSVLRSAPPHRAGWPRPLRGVPPHWSGPCWQH
jgi:MFS family permease